MIEVSNLHKTFRKRKGLFGLSFSIAAGEAVGLLGGQESGKTVLMDVLSGCSVPSSGEVLVDGYDATDESDAIRRIVGYMPNPLPLYPDMTVEEYLDFIYAIKRVRGKNHFSHIIELCRKTGIENLFGRMIKGLTLAAQKRVALAQALIGDPNILLIDDPEDGLDAEDALALRNLIADISISRTVSPSTSSSPSRTY